MTSSAEERRASILERLKTHRMVAVSRLSDEFGVSAVSIRRDLNTLENHGLLKRVHGGAVAIPNVAFVSSYAEKMRVHGEEKERIGRAAAETIQAGDTVIFDSGTTVLQVARRLAGDLVNDGNLTVVTGSLPIVRELAAWGGVRIIVLGGVYLPEYETTVGPSTVDMLSGLHVDKLFLGTDGVTVSRGATTSNLLEAEVNRAMVDAATDVIVVADSSKIGATGLIQMVPAARIDTLVTDKGAPSDFVERLRGQGIEVVLA